MATSKYTVLNQLFLVLSPPSLFGLTTCFCGEFQSQRRTSRPQPSSHPRGVKFSFDPCGTKYGLRDLTSSGAVCMVPGRNNSKGFDIRFMGTSLPTTSATPVSVFQGSLHTCQLAPCINVYQVYIVTVILYNIVVFGSPFSQIQFKEMT